MIDQTVGRYRILERIGAGGLAQAYKAYDPDTSQYVTLKILNPEVAPTDPEFQQRFRSEAEAIARLEHPHLLPVLSYDEINKWYFLVMPYLEAGDLKERIEEGPLPFDEASRLLSQVASALDHVHRHDMLHRDIKPTNILLDKNGDVYLADTGFANILNPTVEAPEILFTTPFYLSPEQGQGLELTPASDIYSLGVVLYEMLTQQLPFYADTPYAVIIKRLHEPLPSPRVLRPDLPEAAERVLFKAMEREPGRRYQTAGAMAAAFAQAVKGAMNSKSDPIPRDSGIEQTLPRPYSGTRATTKTASLWISGSFYVVTTVVLITLLAVIGANVAWPVLVFVCVGGLVAVAIIGALQLRSTDGLSEESFVKLMIETLKYLPLLRGRESSEKSSDKTE